MNIYFFTIPFPREFIARISVTIAIAIETLALLKPPIILDAINNPNVSAIDHSYKNCKLSIQLTVKKK